MNTRMQHQGGWMASFVIVGTLLVVGLLGSLYFVRAQHENAQVATNDMHTQKSNDKQTESDRSEDEKKKEQPTVKDDDKKSAESDKREDTPQSPTIKEDEEEPADNSESVGVATGNGDSDDTGTALPSTGPAETISSLVVIAVLSFAVASYVRSRRMRHQL